MELYEFHHLIVLVWAGSQRLPVSLRSSLVGDCGLRHFRFDLDGGADGASCLRRGRRPALTVPASCVQACSGASRM